MKLEPVGCASIERKIFEPLVFLRRKKNKVCQLEFVSQQQALFGFINPKGLVQRMLQIQCDGVLILYIMCLCMSCVLNIEVPCYYKAHFVFVLIMVSSVKRCLLIFAMFIAGVKKMLGVLYIPFIYKETMLRVLYISFIIQKMWGESKKTHIWNTRVFRKKRRFRDQNLVLNVRFSFVFSVPGATHKSKLR